MSPEGKFLIYCMELFRREKRMSGAEVADYFARHRLCEYVAEFFAVLHTWGDRKIMEDLERQAAMGGGEA